MIFNLLDEKWIPVLWNNGTVSRVGIRGALTQAHRIRQIAASNPMDRVAIIRFLLALLYWCKGNPPTDKVTSSSESFSVEWFSKLDNNKDCFNLLGEGKRFYQCHAVEPISDKDKNHEIIPLIQEIPNGDDKWHFRHSTDKVNGLCRACCAHGLLRLPIFTSGEGRGWHQGINGTPPIYIMPMGTTLLETLVLNWKAVEDIGEPVWVQPVIQMGNIPFLTGMTLLARRVWLHDPIEVATCIACGSRRTPIIKTCEYQSSGPSRNNHWNDPHVLYFMTKKNDRASVRADDLTVAGKFRMDRPWSRLLSHVAKKGNSTSNGKSAPLFIIGFATDKAKNVDVWERTILNLPENLTEEIDTACQQWGQAGQQLEKKIGRAEQEGKATIASIRPHVETIVSAKAGELLAGGGAAWEKAAEEYRPMMEVIANSLSPGFTTAALKRRRDIANTLPDMKPKSEPVKKPAKKKGESK